MNLGQLKQALAKFPTDMDSAEMFLAFESIAGRTYENVCGVGILPIGDTAHLALAGVSYIQSQVENGKMSKPEGYDETIEGLNTPPLEGDEWKNG
jgi:hypothetical protein